MSKVLIPVGDAIEAVDTLYPFFRVQEDGFEAVVAGQDARVYAMVMHEIPPGWDVTRERPSYHIEATVAFRDVDPNEYDGLFVSGGPRARVPALRRRPTQDRASFLRGAKTRCRSLPRRGDRGSGRRDPQPENGDSVQMPTRRRIFRRDFRRRRLRCRRQHGERPDLARPSSLHAGLHAQSNRIPRREGNARSHRRGDVISAFAQTPGERCYCLSAAFNLSRSSSVLKTCGETRKLPLRAVTAIRSFSKRTASFEESIPAKRAVTIGESYPSA